MSEFKEALKAVEQKFDHARAEIVHHLVRPAIADFEAYVRTPEGEKLIDEGLRALLQHDTPELDAVKRHLSANLKDVLVNAVTNAIQRKP